jgi:hypothetical protein
MQNGLPTFVLGAGDTVQTGATNYDAVSKIGFGGKQWMVIGQDASGVAPGADKLTLLLAKGYDYATELRAAADPDIVVNANGSIMFDKASPWSHNYDESVVRAGMEVALNSIGGPEGDAIAAGNLIVSRTLEVGAYNGSTPYTSGIAGTAVDAKFWALSTQEAMKLGSAPIETTDSVRAWRTEDGNSDWWLRSPGDDASVAA